VLEAFLNINLLIEKVFTPAAGHRDIDMFLWVDVLIY